MAPCSGLRSFGNPETLWVIGHEPLNHRLNFPPQHAFVRPGEPRVRTRMRCLPEKSAHRPFAHGYRFPPTTALTCPSNIRANAIFSEVASAWISTKMIGVFPAAWLTSRCVPRKGIFQFSHKRRVPAHSQSRMEADPLSVAKIVLPCPGVPGG